MYVYAICVERAGSYETEVIGVVLETELGSLQEQEVLTAGQSLQPQLADSLKDSHWVWSLVPIIPALRRAEAGGLQNENLFSKQ